MTGARAERGSVEVLPIAFLVLVAGTVLLMNLWGVIDAKAAVDLAAREGVRTYVESAEPAAAEAQAASAARLSIEESGRRPERVHVDGTFPGFDRCGIADIRVTYRVLVLRLPFASRGSATVTVVGHHREAVDRFGSKESGDATCP